MEHHLAHMNCQGIANQMFSGASIGNIYGGNFSIVATSASPVLDRLSAATAHSALHDGPARTDESRCHPHTRLNVLNRLERWARGLEDVEASIFWLHGGAGAGKSAVMQTLAERFTAQGRALGSFFFSRSDSTRNTAEALVPTLAYQLSQRLPSARQVLDTVINCDPLIFKKSFIVQFNNLLVKPLQHSATLGEIGTVSEAPQILLIDGLDECLDSKAQQTIIQAATALCQELGVPVKFLIASRPELAISAAFGQYQQRDCGLNVISLSHDPGAEADIRCYIEAEFHKIRTQHPFKHIIPSSWPSIYDINRLVWRSSSHFIYAATAMKYIWSTQEGPVRSLQVVLGLEVSRIESPFADLDALYRHILERAAHRERVLQILSHCAFSPVWFPGSVNAICIIHEYCEEDFYIFVGDITPLVTVSHDRRGRHLRFLHATLGDFLRDRARSGLLHVDKAGYLASLLARCFHLFEYYSRNQQSTPKWPQAPSYAGTLRYEFADLITDIIRQSGHLLQTQQALRQYDLHYFSDCLGRDSHRVAEYNRGIVYFLAAINSITALDGNRLFRRQLACFIEMWPTCILNPPESGMSYSPLGVAILPLIFAGYPSQYLRKIMAYYADHIDANSLPWHTIFRAPGSQHLLTIMTSQNLASLDCYSLYNSPQSSAQAAEGITEYFIAQVKPDSSATLTAHRSWLRRTKPWKHVALGSPRLAKIKYLRHFRMLRALHGRLAKTSSKLMRHRYMSLRRLIGRQHLLILLRLRKIANLLNALLFVLPKAAASEKLLLYLSIWICPRIVHQHKSGLTSRAQQCFEDYNARVRNAKLKALDQRIDSHDITALMEKSRMLTLDAQD